MLPQETVTNAWRGVPWKRKSKAEPLRQYLRESRLQYSTGRNNQTLRNLSPPWTITRRKPPGGRQAAAKPIWTGGELPGKLNLCDIKVQAGAGRHGDKPRLLRWRSGEAGAPHGSRNCHIIPSTSAAKFWQIPLCLLQRTNPIFPLLPAIKINSGIHDHLWRNHRAILMVFKQLMERGCVCRHQRNGH